MVKEMWKLMKYNVKAALSGLTKFLAIESPLKMMKILLILPWKALFVLEIFKFLSWLLGHIGKRLDYKGKVNFKIYDVTTREKNNCNTHIAQ